MTTSRRSMLTGLILLVLTSTSVQARSDKMQERLDRSAEVLQQLADAPDGGIPEELLGRAECVAVIPGVKRAAFGFGGRYGRGVAACRTNGGEGPWGSPSMLALDGGSFGFQLGGSSMDVVMLFMTPRSMESLMNEKVTLGGEISAAAGPKGRGTSANTDLRFTAEILTYGRSRGLFAGVSLEGASVRPDNDANEDIYGREVDAAALLQQGGQGVPGAAGTFMATLRGFAQ